MSEFYKDITLRALGETPGLISSNWMAVCVSLIAFAATFIIKVGRQQSYKDANTWLEKLRAMRDDWKQNLWDGAKVIIILWILLFAGSLAKTLYLDHQSLVSANDRLVAENKRSKEPQPAPPAVHIPENLRLRERAFELSSKIRKLSGEEKDQDLEMIRRNWSAISSTGILSTGTEQEKQEYRNRSTREHQEMFEGYLRKYHDSYATDAKAVRESLLRKLPPGTRDDSLLWAYEKGFGVDALDKVATDLESLARMIPES